MKVLQQHKPQVQPAVRTNRDQSTVNFLLHSIEYCYIYPLLTLHIPYVDVRVINTYDRKLSTRLVRSVKEHFGDPASIICVQ